ncbi:MAG: FxLYD domain-containing protein [Pseudomonadota bacterium]
MPAPKVAAKDTSSEREAASPDASAAPDPAAGDDAPRADIDDDDVRSDEAARSRKEATTIEDGDRALARAGAPEPEPDPEDDAPDTTTKTKAKPRPPSQAGPVDISKKAADRNEARPDPVASGAPETTHNQVAEPPSERLTPRLQRVTAKSEDVRDQAEIAETSGEEAGVAEDAEPGAGESAQSKRDEPLPVDAEKNSTHQEGLHPDDDEHRAMDPAPELADAPGANTNLPPPSVRSSSDVVDADPQLSAALGEMFATPPASPPPVDRRAPLGVPDGLVARGPVRTPRGTTRPGEGDSASRRPPEFRQPVPERTAGAHGHPAAPDETTAPPPVRRRRLSPSAPPDFVAHDAAAMVNAKSNGTAAPSSAMQQGRPRGFGNGTRPPPPAPTHYPETDFVAPNDIAPDPAFDRSHIDIRTDTPFATDFAATPPVVTPVERRGAQTQTAVVRRRAAIHLGWFALATIIGVLAGIAVLAPDRVVATLPGTSSLYRAAGVDINLRGLDFAGVSYEWTRENGRSAIDVTGRIRNVSASEREVPTVVFVLFDKRGDELFTWARQVHNEPVAAGEEVSFSARIPAPPDATRKLRVRFARQVR